MEADINNSVLASTIRSKDKFINMEGVLNCGIILFHHGNIKMYIISKNDVSF